MLLTGLCPAASLHAHEIRPGAFDYHRAKARMVRSHLEGAGILGLISIMATLFVIVAIVSAFIVSLKLPWTRIVVRVAGSWVAAMGMLMFGWLMRGQG